MNRRRCVLCLREGDKRFGTFDDGAAESFRLREATVRSWVPVGGVVGLHANEGGQAYLQYFYQTIYRDLLVDPVVLPKKSWSVDSEHYRGIRASETALQIVNSLL